MIHQTSRRMRAGRAHAGKTPAQPFLNARERRGATGGGIAKARRFRVPRGRPAIMVEDNSDILLPMEMRRAVLDSFYDD